jgi:hypothetical protein
MRTHEVYTTHRNSTWKGDVYAQSVSGVTTFRSWLLSRVRRALKDRVHSLGFRGRRNSPRCRSFAALLKRSATNSGSRITPLSSADLITATIRIIPVRISNACHGKEDCGNQRNRAATHGRRSGEGGIQAGAIGYGDSSPKGNPARKRTGQPSHCRSGRSRR